MNFLSINPRPQTLSLPFLGNRVFLPSPSAHISILTQIKSNQVSISHPPYFFFPPPSSLWSFFFHKAPHGGFHISLDQRIKSLSLEEFSATNHSPQTCTSELTFGWRNFLSNGRYKTRKYKRNQIKSQSPAHHISFFLLHHLSGLSSSTKPHMVGFTYPWTRGSNHYHWMNFLQLTTVHKHAHLS
jgi:hypothetical protein